MEIDGSSPLMQSLLSQRVKELSGSVPMYLNMQSFFWNGEKDFLDDFVIP